MAFNEDPGATPNYSNPDQAPLNALWFCFPSPVASPLHNWHKHTPFGFTGLCSFVYQQNKNKMRKIIVTTFMTMDGVLQAPGGPEEDRTNGFKWGGWQFLYQDVQTRKALEKIFSTPFDLLLGRRTY
jgi:hypothetical protein